VFALFQMSTDNDSTFNACVECGCLYHRTIGKQNCLNWPLGNVQGKGFFSNRGSIYHSPGEHIYQQIRVT
jgi:hypothetical protein